MKKGLVRILFFFAVVVGLPLWAADPVPVKYVFLFIGDGMSLPQRMLTQEYRHRLGQPDLLINRLPISGITTTHAHNSLITDSAAAGTAIACGDKTNSGVLGLDPNGKRLESVAELAHRNGRRVGIITSVSIDHATPAAFYAHNAGRGNYYDIGKDLLAAKFDYFGGGDFLKPDGKDGNLYDLAAKAGYQVIRDRNALLTLTPGDKPVLALAPVTYAIDKLPGQIALSEYLTKGIALLDNPNGFFIMVEGGRIDWACHANDAASVLQEVIAFDQAVEVAWNFAQQHPKDTLLVVTGDHETGALTLGFAGTAYASYLERLQHQKISYEKFGDLLKQRRDAGKFTFDDLKPLVTEYFGLKFTGEKNDPMVLNSYELAKLQAAFARSAGQPHPSATEPDSVLYGGYNPVCVTLTHILANKSGLGWNSYAHTALPVSTTAYGKQAEAFSGMTDNTGIARRLKPMVAKLQP